MRTALFTVSFAGLWGQDRLTLEASIDLAADLGYDGVEIMGKRPHLSVLDYTEDDCRRLRERVERHGLRVRRWPRTPTSPEAPARSRFLSRKCRSHT